MNKETRGCKTWPNFILSFTKAHQEIRDTDATVDELGFHSANAIVSQILEQLRKEYTPSAEVNTLPEASMHNP